ncbi:BlaR1 family beta-lactam sensor/signal transducer [Anaerovorax odorimutans]|nr:BlaR1 family beta-lactam sensor/signal transducer [Anaerovorax odorimutans]
MTELFFYGILYSFILTFLLLVLLLSKSAFSRLLSPRGQYRLWLVLPAAAAAPFLPSDLSGLFFLREETVPAAGSELSAASMQQPSGMETIRDLAVSADRGIPQIAICAILVLWAAGLLFMLARLFYQLWKSRMLFCSAAPVTSVPDTEVFYQCREKIRLKRRVFFGSSPLCKTPSALGILRPAVLLPQGFHGRDLKYVLLHELAHHRYLDPFTNLLLAVFRAVFWFNPVVHLTVKQIALDRELACDDLVLELLDEKEAPLYGQAILNSMSAIRPAAALGFAAGRKGIHKRILQIAKHRSETAAAKRLCTALMVFFLCLTVLCVPSASALTQTSYEQNQDLNILHEDLSPYFDNLNGSFVLYDQARDRYTVYDEEAARTRVSPDSTYKIYSGLLALESGSITRDNSALKWDGTGYPFAEWNRDQTLDTAMGNSVNWYFQALDKKAGKEKLQTFFDKLQYGNRDLSSGIENSWLEASLKISPLEQVLLLRDLSENRWNLDPHNIAAIQRALHISPGLYGKTGTGNLDGHSVNGWFVGWLETGSNTYFFAVNVRGKDGASGSSAREIAETILMEKGLLKKEHI